MATLHVIECRNSPIVSPLQGFRCYVRVSQGGASRLSPLRSALG